MCGIVGIFSINARETIWPRESLEAMVRSVAHRGPNGSGSFFEPGVFFGHSRLAVIDITSAGRQPMISSNNRYVITFNGEIYNYKELKIELKSKGCEFSTESDTEVLLAAWIEWGEHSLDKLQGIFAFAVFDRQERILFLIRDQLGVKPLFYQVNNGQIYFASEVLALFSSINPCPSENLCDVDSYFTFNYVAAPRTGLTGVSQLQPGSCLRADSKGISVSQYWTPHYQTELISYNQASIDDFKQILTGAVQSQLGSDVPLGVFLSGGLDSYSVASAAVSSGIKPYAFTLGFEEKNFDETSAAIEYADFLHIQDKCKKFIWNESIIEETLGAMSELLADASCFPLYQLSAFTRKFATVVLSGDGGDELFAGYATYRAGNLTPYLRQLPISIRSSLKNMARYLPSDSQRYGTRMVLERMLGAAEAGPRRDHASFRLIMSDELKHRFYCDDFSASVVSNDPIAEYTAYMDLVPSGCSYLAARQHADLLFHLPSILAKVDRMSMAHGLEVRVPLLCPQLVEFCLNLDDSAKLSGFSSKRILRKALGNNIPPQALRRSKAGFLPPVDSWFRKSGPMITVFGDYLATAKRSFDTLKWDEVDLFWQQHRSGHVEGGFVLLGILQYINWRLKCTMC